MSIFLCWSGTRSREVANCLKTALQKKGLQVAEEKEQWWTEHAAEFQRKAP